MKKLLFSFLCLFIGISNCLDANPDLNKAVIKLVYDGLKKQAHTHGYAQMLETFDIDLQEFGKLLATRYDFLLKEKRLEKDNSRVTHLCRSVWSSRITDTVENVEYFYELIREDVQKEMLNRLEICIECSCLLLEWFSNFDPTIALLLSNMYNTELEQ